MIHRRKDLAGRIGIVMLLLLPALARPEGLYRCLDASGRPVYADQLCGQVPDKRIYANGAAPEAPAVGNAPRAEASSALTPYEQGLVLYNEKRYAEAFVWLLRASDAGNNRARTLLGLLYFKGWGTDRDLGQAFTLFQLAAVAGEADAQANLGYLYEQGLGVPQNIEQARGWYRQAAAKGVAMAVDRLKVIGSGASASPAETPSLPKPAFTAPDPFPEEHRLQEALRAAGEAMHAEEVRQAAAERQRRLWELINRVALGVMLLLTVLQAAGDSRRKRSPAG